MFNQCHELTDGPERVKEREKERERERDRERERVCVRERGREKKKKGRARDSVMKGADKKRRRGVKGENHRKKRRI